MTNRIGTVLSRNRRSPGEVFESKNCWARVRIHSEVVTRGGGRVSTDPEHTVMWRTCICSQTNPCGGDGWKWEETNIGLGKTILFGERCFLEHTGCHDIPCTGPLIKNVDGFWDPGGAGGLLDTYPSMTSMKSALEFGGNAWYGEVEGYCRPDPTPPEPPSA